MPNSDPEGRIFISAPNNHDRFFFLNTFWSPVFYFNVGVAINESRSYTLTFAILTFDVVCDVAMTSTPNALTTELRDLLYNQCIGNTCFRFLSIPRIGCKIRFVSTDENLGKPCLVCKKILFFIRYKGHYLTFLEFSQFRRRSILQHWERDLWSLHFSHNLYGTMHETQK